ncbi:hypothetical protein MRB53_040312 [Persea americana]|nr:hypothetical protein MRB53_040312 [Persea americana]
MGFLAAGRAGTAMAQIRSEAQARIKGKSPSRVLSERVPTVAAGGHDSTVAAVYHDSTTMAAVMDIMTRVTTTTITLRRGGRRGGPGLSPPDRTRR